jgi:hypothetical protein
MNSTCTTSSPRRASSSGATPMKRAYISQTSTIAKKTCRMRLSTVAKMRTLRSSSLAGCQSCRHRVANACQRLSAATAAGGDVGSRARKIARMDSASAPVTAPALDGIEANHARQPGGNSPAGRSGRSERRVRRRSASIRSADENIG